MIENIKENLLASRVYIKIMIKWIILGTLTGFLCGGVGIAFHYAVSYVTSFRTHNAYIIYGLPIAGLIIVFLYKLAKMDPDAGTNMIISSIRSEDKPPIVLAPLIFVGTVLTHLCGGSSGREGAALQIGGSIGAFIGKIIKLDENDLKVITMCGMSGVFSALFGTPLTATIFCMEVISVGIIYYAAFFPCMISSLIAAGLAKYFGIMGEHYHIVVVPNTSLESLIKVAVLAALCAGLSIIFVVAMHKAHWLYEKLFKNEYLRVFAGGVIIIVLTLLVGTNAYNGAGMPIIEEAFTGTVRPEAFLLKIIFTAFTLGAGFKGGEIVPTFFIGATFGNLVASIMGLNTGFGAAIGLVSMFCSVVNCPIASIFLSVELFGSSNMVLFAIACGVSYLLSGYYGLYSSQKIVYSKLRPQYIDRGTK